MLGTPPYMLGPSLQSTRRIASELASVRKQLAALATTAPLVGTSSALEARQQNKLRDLKFRKAQLVQ